MTRLLPLLLASALLPGVAAAQETRASAEAKLAAEFRASDTDKDGGISRAELLARLTKMRAGKADLDKTHANRIADLIFTSADANKDGKLSRKEADALMTASFRRYDANGDGRVDGAEASKARSDARAKAGKAGGR